MNMTVPAAVIPESAEIAEKSSFPADLVFAPTLAFTGIFPRTYI
jgi:hypothetical protein